MKIVITAPRQPATGACRRRLEWIATLVTVAPVFGQVISYEATSFPEVEDTAWQHSTFCTPDRSIVAGWLIQSVEPGQCADPPSGDRDSYTRDIDELQGVSQFFLEFRLQVLGESSELPWVAPAAVTAGTLGPVFYGFTIARDLVKFDRDSFAEVVFVAIAPDVPHTLRLELYGDQAYLWYIDSQLAWSGVPGGPFPAGIPSINWRAKSAFLESTVMVDYLRFGVIPADASADFDTDSDRDLRDFHFFHECASTVGIAGQAAPSCAWADCDADGDVDFSDFAEFQLLFTGGDNQ